MTNIAAAFTRSASTDQAAWPERCTGNAPPEAALPPTRIASVGKLYEAPSTPPRSLAALETPAASAPRYKQLFQSQNQAHDALEQLLDADELGPLTVETLGRDTHGLPTLRVACPRVSAAQAQVAAAARLLLGLAEPLEHAAVVQNNSQEALENLQTVGAAGLLRGVEEGSKAVQLIALANMNEGSFPLIQHLASSGELSPVDAQCFVQGRGWPHHGAVVAASAPVAHEIAAGVDALLEESPAMTPKAALLTLKATTEQVWSRWAERATHGLVSDQDLRAFTLAPVHALIDEAEQLTSGQAPQAIEGLRALQRRAAAAQ